MTPTIIGYLTLAAVVVSTITLWINAAQGDRRNREYLERRLDAMQAQIDALQMQITAVATDVAKIFGWLEGQRDQRMSQPDIPPR